MCGGAGTPLWPVSRDTHPKQFVSLLGLRSTFQAALLRVDDPDLFDRPIVVTQASYLSLVQGQI
ncbi:sugar phosphate nucleotidyltransferase [Bradyrhizobium sp. SZCCHNR1018]|uniref:sugar phosphate nucleotidyltransferase n=1 Tax=unclassified Bradyrhizobium TaxID=2631580 RepID=UPI00396563CB